MAASARWERATALRNDAKQNAATYRHFPAVSWFEMKVLYRSVAVCAVCVTAVSTALGADMASVKGRVLTAGGEPLSDASVYLESLQRPATGRPVLAKTDQSGYYEVRLGEAGEYVIHAFKEDAGYPDVVFAFNLAPNQVLPKVKVQQGQKLTGVDVKLGPKSGTLHLRVTDKKTGDAITLADYNLCQVLTPAYCIDTRAAGEYDFLVPPTDITIHVSAQGYTATEYTEGGQPFVRVTPGESRDLSIPLAPE
jgi:hypothetical protein